MSSYSEFASNLAQLTQAGANAQARGIEERGQIWGQAIGNLGQIAAQIPAQYHQQKIVDVLKAHNGDVDAALPEIMQIDPTLGSSLSQRLMEAKKTAYEFQIKKWEHDKAGLDFARNLVGSATDPETYAQALYTAKLVGADTSAFPASYDPKFIESTNRSLMTAQQRLEADKPQFEPMQVNAAGVLNKKTGEVTPTGLTPRITNETELALAAADPSSPLHGQAMAAQTQKQQAAANAPITPYQQAQLDETKRLRDIEAGNLAVARQRETREGKTAAVVAAEIKQGSPEFRVAQDLATGKMTFPQFRTLEAYNRNAGQKLAIYDMARQLNPEFDPSRYELGFKMASNPQIRQRIVAINSLAPVIDQAEALATQVGNTDIPALNKLLQAGKFQVGNHAVTNFRQLQTLLGDEVGNALGVGSGSDLKTRLGLDLVNPNLGPKQFADTMNQLRSVLDARRTELIRQMGIYGEAAQPAPSSAAPAAMPTPTAAPTGMIRARDPQGKLHEAAAGTPLPAGWTLEK